MPFRALRIGYASGVHATGPLYDKMRKPVKWFLKVFSGPLVRPPDHRVPVRLVPNTYAFYGMYNTPRISYTDHAMRETQEERGNEMKTERVKGPIAKTSMCGCDGESRCVLHTEPRPYDLCAGIMQYEDGKMDVPEFLELFSYLIRTGTAWTLQGFYGREAARLIQNGIITQDGTLTAKAHELADEQ